MACLLSGGVKARVRVSRVRVGARLGPRLRLRLRASSERRRGCARCACIPPWRRQQRRASLHLEVVGNVARLTNDVLPPPMGEDEQRSSGGRAGGEDGQVARRRHRVGGKKVWREEVGADRGRGIAHAGRGRSTRKRRDAQAFYHYPFSIAAFA